MANPENETDTFESKTVKNYINHLENGTSVVQKNYEDPSYAKNFLKNSVPQGLAQYNLRQGLSDQGCKSTLYLTQEQLEENNFFNKKGSKAIGIISWKKQAFWNKEDKEVVEGKQKAGTPKTDENGKPVYQLDEKGNPVMGISVCSAAENVVRPKWQAELDENGEALTYQQTTYKENEVYTKDRIYRDKDNNILYEAKVGEPVVEHLAGTKVGKFVSTNQRITPAEKNILPPISDDKELFKLPTVKDEKNAFEVLKCGMAKAFRAMYYGGEGWKPSVSEIKLIKDEFISKPGLFAKAMSQADTYGRGNIESCQKMESRIQEKLQQKENQQKNVKENVNTNHKGRK